MGQCAVFCSTGQKYTTEINVEQLNKSKTPQEQLIVKYSSSPFFPKVIYLQNQIKKHIYASKSLNKHHPNFEGNLAKIKTCEESNTGQVLKTENISLNDKSISNNNINNPNNNNNILITDVIVASTSNNNNNNNNNLIHSNISNSNINNNNNSNHQLTSSSNVNNQSQRGNSNSNTNCIHSQGMILIPSISVFFKDNPLITNNPFIINTPNQHSTPDEQTDGIIKLLPIIHEDDFVCEGALQHGKVNGEGIIIYRSHNKLLCNFKDNQIKGLTKIINEENDIYIGNFENNSAKGLGYIKTSK
jgi:hypothetical protein